MAEAPDGDRLVVVAEQLGDAVEGAALGARGVVAVELGEGDGRAVQLGLNKKGIAAQRRANAHWEVVRKQIEGSLHMSKADVRAALQALDDAAGEALLARRSIANRRQLARAGGNGSS